MDNPNNTTKLPFEQTPEYKDIQSDYEWSCIALNLWLQWQCALLKRATPKFPDDNDLMSKYHHELADIQKVKQRATRDAYHLWEKALITNG